MERDGKILGPEIPPTFTTNKHLITNHNYFYPPLQMFLPGMSSSLRYELPSLEALRWAILSIRASRRRTSQAKV